MTGNKSQSNSVWSSVWARLVLNRIENQTWQATFTIPTGFEYNRCFQKEIMEKATTSEDLAFDIFDADFSRLRPDWQIALSGNVASNWFAYDRKLRGIN